MYLKYNYRTLSPAFDVVDFLPIYFMTLSTWGGKCVVNVMPDFEPNEYLFRTHADKGKERWEIYAWALRDAMGKHGNFEFSEIALSRKLAYQNYMNFVGSGQDIEAKSLLFGNGKNPKSLNDSTGDIESTSSSVNEMQLIKDR